jgi:NAD+ kinase
MSSNKLRFALFGNLHQAKKSASIQKILCYLSEIKSELYIDKDFYEFLTIEQQIDVTPTKLIDNNDFDADFAISMGGDGTFLKTASRVGNKNIPILGINIGRLGFLADVNPSDIEKSFDALYSGHYTIEDRAVIKVENDGESFEGYPYALNDVAILKRDNASMINIRVTISGEYLTTYMADGLVISTPTGSTAYSLSIGGPIIVPQSGILSLTPVAPHSLNIRPIVIGDDCEITMNVESRSHNFLVAIDGRSEKCKEGSNLRITKAPYTIKIVKHSNQEFFQTLRQKLMWGADTRN